MDAAIGTVPRRYSEIRSAPPGLRVPPLVGTLIAAAVAAGPIVGATSGRGPAPLRVVRSIFWSSALGYLVTSLVDFAEHFRLEKAATGRYLASAVVPVGETLNHLAIRHVCAPSAIRASNRELKRSREKQPPVLSS